MPAQLIADRITKVALPDLARALSAGFRAILNSDFPSAMSMAGAFAQLCLESGNGEKNHCFNFHNEKRGSDWEGAYTRFKCDELFDERTARVAQTKSPGNAIVSLWKGGPLRRVVLLPPHPWSEFVAFDGAPELEGQERDADGARQGASRYIEFLSCRDRYRKSWTALYHGDVHTFGYELHAAGYYTAEPDTYTRGLVSIAKRSLPVCDATLANERRSFTDDEIASILAIGTATAASTLWVGDRHFERVAA